MNLPRSRRNNRRAFAQRGRNGSSSSNGRGMLSLAAFDIDLLEERDRPHIRIIELEVVTELIGEPPASI